jgi:hypothetical protein
MTPKQLTTGNWVLLVACLVLGVVRLVTGPSGDTGPTGADREAAFGAFDPSTILRISLAEGEAPPLRLARASSEDPWTVVGRQDFPALGFLVETLVGSLVGLRQSDLVSEEASSHGIFGVDAGTLLTLEAPGAAPWTFVLGEAGREGGGTHGYLRAAAEDRVFALRGLGDLSLEPRAWIDPRLVDFDASAVEGVRFSVAGTSITIVRDDKGRWSEELTGAPAPRVGAEDLIGLVGGLALDDVAARPVGSEQAGFDGELLVVELLGGVDGEEPWPVLLELGGEAEDGRRYVRSGSWRRAGRPDWVGLLPAAVVTRLEGRVHDLLLGIGG